MGSSHAIEYYLGIKINEALICATTGMNLENILNQRNQSQMTTYDMIPFPTKYLEYGIRKFIEKESRLTIA